MKSAIIMRLTFFMVLAIGIGVASFQFFHKPVTTQAIEEVDQEIVLVLPGSEFTILSHSLDDESGELVIPIQNKNIQKVEYNPSLGILEAIDPPKEYAINIKKLKNSLALYPSDKKVKITPSYIIREHNQPTLTDFNEKLARIYRTPLSISVKDGGSYSDVYLDPATLRNLILPLSTDIQDPIELNKSKLIAEITARLTPKQKGYFVGAVAYQNVRTAINARFRDEESPIVLGVDDGPSSRGELAQRYLEVDLSQQKMYFFMNGSLYNQYKISTGIDYPTPVGEYHILNKAPIAFSSIYNVWMPYWMGFKYANDVGAYLGLHEIAYAKDAKGKPVYRHGYYIGEMMTGGCVAMEPKDAKNIYNLSEVGMLVRIVK